MAKKNLYFIFSSFIHIFRLHLVSPFCEHSYPAGAGKTPIRSQGSKVQEKTDTDKLFLEEKKQEQAVKNSGMSILWKRACPSGQHNVGFCINRAPPRAQTCRFFCLICETLVAKIQRTIMKWQLVIADFMTGGRGIVKYLISGLSETEAL